MEKNAYNKLPEQKVKYSLVIQTHRSSVYYHV